MQPSSARLEAQSGRADQLGAVVLRQRRLAVRAGDGRVALEREHVKGKRARAAPPAFLEAVPA